MKDPYAVPGNAPEPESARDVESDPALDDRLGSDWSDEGGAAPTGPATSTGADDPEDDPVAGDTDSGV